MANSRRSRRTILSAGAASIAATAGCISAPFGETGPEERTYSIVLQESGGDITASVDPAGDVSDVVQVRVGDDVTFEVENERDSPTVFHNHVPHEEMTVDAGGNAEMTFTPTEERVGTHEVEVFDAEHASDDGGHDDGEDDGHDDGGDDGHDDGDDGGHDAEEIYVILTVEVRPAGG